MESKNYKLPAIVWLRVTDYMLPWVQWELGGNVRVKNMRLVSVQHLEGARDILREDTVQEAVPQRLVDKSMSATWRNAVDAGMSFDPAAMEREYGVTKEVLQLFVPIECPRNCITQDGVLRPWSNDTNFSKHQATALQDLLRHEFWQAVGAFSEGYAAQREGERYAQVEMIEAFCRETKTPDMYVDAMRREWQRRVKRTK
jgi:hypothetical protein